MYALTLKQALIDLLKQSTKVEKIIFKKYIINKDICNWRTHYRVLEYMWEKYLEIYRKLSTSIYQK
jgi:hypothetical protein